MSSVFYSYHSFLSRPSNITIAAIATIQIIKNSGIETIGGFVNADIVFASLNLLFISIILNFKCIKYITFKMVINAKSYNNY